MNLFERERIKSYRLGIIKFSEDLQESPEGIIMFKSPEQALRWVMWLRNDLKLPLENVIEEVERQCNVEQLTPSSPWDFEQRSLETLSVEKILKTIEIHKALRRGIADIKFKCPRCGKPTNYGDACTIELKELTGTSSRVISRGLTGGSVAREITNHYTISKLKVCPSCAEKDRRKKRLHKIINILFWVSIPLAIAITVIINLM